MFIIKSVTSDGITSWEQGVSLTFIPQNNEGRNREFRIFSNFENNSIPIVINNETVNIYNENGILLDSISV
jgi:hypothetical protein